MKKILPIGTIVTLKHSEGERMLIGYYPKNEKVIFDYSAVIYPVGLHQNGKVSFINSEDILSVEQKGFENELFHRVAKNMSQLEDQIKAEVQ